MNINVAKQIVLDTETTGMNKFGIPYEGHKIIEIGAVEIINRRLSNREFHVYLNPKRPIDYEAFRIHGISDQFLIKKPIFSDIVNEFLMFIKGSELIIHNASFDLGFLNYELKNTGLNVKNMEFYCVVIDTLKMARKIFPGQRNNLDALCERYGINRSNRILHNALIDAKLLSQVFLCMTGGQKTIQFKDSVNRNTLNTVTHSVVQVDNTQQPSKIKKKESLKIIYANKTDQINHEKYLEFIMKVNNNCLWK